MKKHHLDRRIADIVLKADEFKADELLDTKTVARWLGVSPQWLEIGRGKGWGPPFVKLSKNMVRYRREDVVRWLVERIKTPAA